MKKLFFYLFVIFPFLISAQVKTEKYFLDEEWEKCDSASAEYTRINYYNDTINNACVSKIYNQQGILIRDVEYSDIKKWTIYGYSKEYYDNGTLKVSAVYKNDTLDGEFTTYYPSGQLRRKEFHSDGERTDGKCFTSTGADTAFFEYRQMPEYPGGIDALVEFLKQNVVYPKKSRKKGITGKVLVSFIVDKKGFVKNAKVVKSVEPLIDAEALRVVNIMNRWTPGTMDGEFVSVLYNLPINFILR